MIHSASTNFGGPSSSRSFTRSVSMLTFFSKSPVAGGQVSAKAIENECFQREMDKFQSVQ